MALAIRQSVNFQTDGASSATESITINGVLSGSALFAIYSGYQNNQPSSIVSSVSTGGNTFTLAARANRGINDLEAGIYYRTGVASGNYTVDFNLTAPSSTITNITVLEVTGLHETNGVYTTMVGWNTNAASSIGLYSGEITSVTGCVLLAVACTGGDFASDINLAATVDVSGGTVTDIEEQPNGNTVGTLVVSHPIATTAARNLTFTHNAATYGNIAVGVVLRPAEGAQRFKFYVDSSAQSVSGVSAVVWENSGITGTEYIESTGLAFQASLDSGRAVLYVNCPSNLGLANGTSVKGVAYNSTYTTGIMTGVVEAGAA